MALRGVWQLQKLIVSYSDWGGSSRGIRMVAELGRDRGWPRPPKKKKKIIGSVSLPLFHIQIRSLFLSSRSSLHLSLSLLLSERDSRFHPLAILCCRCLASLQLVLASSRLASDSSRFSLPRLTSDFVDLLIFLICLTRAFMESHLPAFKESNPQLEVVTEMIRGQHPHLKAFYKNHNERVVCVRNMDAEEVLLHATRLRNALGRKVIKLRTRHVTKHPSVQGTWTTALKY